MRTARLPLYLMVVGSGVAGLSWEILWQHHAGLAIGASARATALTLACTMLGLAVGSVLMGRWLRGRPVDHPLRIYGLLELVIGLSGLVLGPAFAAVGALDALVWRAAPEWAPLVQVVAMALVLGPPTLAMGATIPVFVRIAAGYDSSVSRLYALNSGGAAIGVLAAAFVLIPALGVGLTASAASLINIVVCLGCWVSNPVHTEDPAPSLVPAGMPVGLARALVFLTGWCTFVLEVAWFRSFRAAFQSTTDGFALVLVAVLLPLAIGARLAARIRTRRTVTTLLAVAGVLILLGTPVVERFDVLLTVHPSYALTALSQLGAALLVLGPPMLALGVVLPWVLDHVGSAAAGRLYGLNTAGAVVGALLAGWWLLPALGSAPTAWIAGGTAALVGGWTTGGLRRWSLVAAGVLGGLVAWSAESGVGRSRVQGAHLTVAHTVLASAQGPDATISVVEYRDGVRELVIDGFQTSGEAQTGHYMAWMGHLPMLMHPAPKRALVICFGTGQTANAVRREGPESLHIVDLSQAVFDVAGWFESNQGVLDDPRVRAIAMDGRAWMRRTDAQYDVVTLEPMAPYFAGTNSLYSREFYARVKSKLAPGGLVAQWLPLHLVTPADAASVARTFSEVFPASWLWIDPVDRTGILVGGLLAPSPTPALPGLSRLRRDLAPQAIRDGFRLDPAGLKRLALYGGPITDDNQRLAYGSGRREKWRFRGSARVHMVNLELVDSVRSGQ